MRIYLLDGKDMTDKETAFTVISEEMSFPEWFGRNLDALYDCLTEIPEDDQVIFVNTSLLVENLGEYGDGILACFNDASEENGFTLRMKQ